MTSAPLWQVFLVAIGGSVVGGLFALAGAWFERSDARKTRREERAELAAAADRAQQRVLAEQLMRETDQPVTLAIAVDCGACVA
jgi:hypothetical protein